MRTSAGALILGAGFLLVGAAVTRAAEYPGWGDTGWEYASKRECCAAAIEIAASYSATAGTNSGGVPRLFRGATERGTCSAEWTQDDAVRASVWCR